MKPNSPYRDLTSPCVLPRRGFLSLAAVAAARLVLPDIPAAHAAGADREPGVRRESFGKLPDGAEVFLYTLSNGRGLEARVMTYGATLLTLSAPDRHGKAEPLTLYLDSLADHLRLNPLLGSVVGRYANRIANARFTIDGTEHKLTANSGPHHIHGGSGTDAFHRALWTAEPLREPGAVGVRLRHVSPDGTAGFPGTVRVTATYKLMTAEDRLVMEYEASTDKPTHVNLTNHAYWNLAGAGSGDVLGHVLQLNADRYVVPGEAKIPTGEIRPVKGTPLDFTEPKTIGADLDKMYGQNYDHCYVINRRGGDRLSFAARVSEPKSGRVMEVYTTQPGVHLFTGRSMSDRLKGGGKAYGPYHGLCLETQHFPDAPNQPAFPSTLLRPGQTLREITEHRFVVQK